MGSYYRHTRTESVGLTYSFRCEQCGQESGPRSVTITGEAEMNNYRRQLNDVEEDKLRQKAHVSLVQRVQEVYKNVTEKQVIPTDFPDECPHCHQPQSWAVSGMKKKMFETPITCLAVGVFFSLIGLGGYYWGDVDYITIPIVIGIAAAGAGIGLICLLWNIIKIQSKLKKTSSGMQRGLPVIEWASVQELLNEK
ncbi:MAG: hypothetical protein NC123_05780 [Butyrivibrio sp.]|nr:hypothetical protein [Acetatifactor muris]MCM1559038.1 hypothetical protein [Butyrivibrio sp.]